MNDENIVAHINPDRWEAEQYENGVVFIPNYWVTKIGKCEDQRGWEIQAKLAGAFKAHASPDGMTAMFTNEDKARAFAESL